MNVSVATAASASVAVYAYTADPPLVGVPDSVRVPASNDRPAGGSGLSAYVTVPSPPVAAGSTRFMIAVFGVYIWFATVAVPKSGGFADGVAVATVDHSPLSVAILARTRTSYAERLVSEPMVAVASVPVCPASVQAVSLASLYSTS